MEFLDRLNLQHKNLQFTMEKSTNTLPFLDMELKIHNDNLQSWIWRKSTHTGVFFKFLLDQYLKSFDKSLLNQFIFYSQAA